MGPLSMDYNLQSGRHIMSDRAYLVYMESDKRSEKMIRGKLIAALVFFLVTWWIWMYLIAKQLA